MALTVNLNSSMYGLLNTLQQLDNSQSQIMARLASGQRINKASDDPSGMMVLASMNSDLARVQASLDNNHRSKGILDTADAALGEMGKITAEIERLANAAKDPNLSATEKTAYQNSIDQYLDTLDTLVSNTEYAGKKIFSGTNAIAVTSAQAKYKDVRVWAAANAASDKVFSVAYSAATKDITVDGVAMGKANANGDEVSFTKDGYTLSFTVSDVSTNIIAAAITVTHGQGQVFQTGTDSTTQTRLDLAAGITSAELGDFVGGYLSSLRTGQANAISSDTSNAANIAAKASQQIATAQARVGGFNKFQVQSSINVLQVMADGLNNSISTIQQVDTARDTAELQREAALRDVTLTMLSLASSQQTSALSLLRSF